MIRTAILPHLPDSALMHILINSAFPRKDFHARCSLDAQRKLTAAEARCVFSRRGRRQGLWAIWHKNCWLVTPKTRCQPIS